MARREILCLLMNAEMDIDKRQHALSSHLTIYAIDILQQLRITQVFYDRIKAKLKVSFKLCYLFNTYKFCHVADICFQLFHKKLTLLIVTKIRKFQKLMLLSLRCLFSFQRQ